MKCFSEFCEPRQQINRIQGGGRGSLWLIARWSEVQVTTWTCYWNERKLILWDRDLNLWDLMISRCIASEWRRWEQHIRPALTQPLSKYGWLFSQFALLWWQYLLYPTHIMVKTMYIQVLCICVHYSFKTFLEMKHNSHPSQWVFLTNLETWVRSAAS